MEKSDIGVIGLAVMGENLALNLERNGWNVSVWNRTVPGLEEKVAERFIQERAADKNIRGFESLPDFVASLAAPRRIFIMVRAGKAVEQLIASLLPFLSPEDILIDGGNSHFMDTELRMKKLQSKGIYLIGAGISGGEEGALNGASIMPGGSIEAWPVVKPILQSIAAKHEDGTPCCEWVGTGGAGHYVKMVHNGIEYADMQLIADSYFVLQHLTDLTQEQMSEVFARWNKRKLKSYLIEITTAILAYRDQTGGYLLDKIVDVAGQKGMGKWSVISALDLEIPLILTATAIFERNLSVDKLTRTLASRTFRRSESLGVYNSNEITESLYGALYLSRLASYAQGFNLLREASVKYNWNLQLNTIASLWQNGCVIRSASLLEIERVFESNPDISNLLLDPYFTEEIKEMLPAWKRIVAEAVREEVAIPGLSSALNYFYSLSSKQLPVNLIQAQRDYFGAHTFERIDEVRGHFFHENWNHQESMSSSGIYNA